MACCHGTMYGEIFSTGKIDQAAIATISLLFSPKSVREPRLADATSHVIFRDPRLRKNEKRGKIFTCETDITNRNDRDKY